MIFLEYIGSRACLSAIKGVSLVGTRFTPFLLPNQFNRLCLCGIGMVQLPLSLF